MESPREALCEAEALCEEQAAGGARVGAEARLVRVMALLACSLLDRAGEELESLGEEVSELGVGEEADWMQCRALLSRLRGDHERAVAIGLDARRLLQESGGDDRERMARLANLLGQSFAFLGDLEGALGYYGEAFEHLGDTGEAKHRGVIANNVARLHEDLGDTASAAYWFQRGLELCEEEATYIRSVLLGNFAQLHTREGRPEEALVLLEDAHRMCVELGMERGVATMTHKMGVAHLAAGRVEVARGLLETAYRSRCAVGEANDIAESRLLLAELAALDGERGAAVELLLEALRELKGSRTGPIGAKCLYALYRMYRESGEDRQALEAYEEYVDLTVRRRDEQGLRQMRALEMRYRVEQLRIDVRQSHGRVSRLEHLSRRDALTGVYNRGALDEFLREFVAEAHGSNAPLCVLFIDFDHFKWVNDTFSHQVGDQVLQRGVELFEAQIRETDVLGRYGGEEFLCLLQGAPLEVGARVAERVRLCLYEYDWEQVAEGLRIRCSVGVAVLREGETVNEVVGRADAALCRAKRTRDTVVVDL
jgi:diguanylate cyclase (GGDEF)-like protein